ncbi:MAG TPA: glutamate racemase [Pseudolabrys sp.]|nr:glutamate racemase [Pseudolabrys sp.]
MTDVKPATILVFDSGVGGLTVFREIKVALPDAAYVYVADDAGFPYGDKLEAALIERILAVIGAAIAQHAPDLVVIACNTASTLALAHLRAKFSVPFVGTVPAIKPACAQSNARRVAVLGTRATVSLEYTRALIREFSAGCDVGLVGSSHLATYAEAELAGTPVADDAIKAEIAPCFIDAEGRRTDTVVLACTHYPLLTARFRSVAPWPVEWLDPAPAIARRVVDLIGPRPQSNGPVPARMIFTSSRAPAPALARMLAGFGF